MTTYLGKSCSFCLPRVPFVNCRQFMYLVISLFCFEGRIWDLIVSVPDHCLSFYFVNACITVKIVGGISLCNGGKLEESEGSNYFYIVFCVLESK